MASGPGGESVFRFTPARLPPAPLYPPNSPEIQTALAQLARIRELSADCDARPSSQAAARDDLAGGPADDLPQPRKRRYGEIILPRHLTR